MTCAAAASTESPQFKHTRRTDSSRFRADESWIALSPTPIQEEEDVEGSREMAELERISSLTSKLADSKPVTGGLRDLSLHAALDHPGQLSALLKWPEGQGLNDRDEDGDRTPLHWSAARGHQMCVEVLLAAGADASIEDSGGHTAGELARLHGHDSIACAQATVSTQAQGWRGLPRALTRCALHCAQLYWSVKPGEGTGHPSKTPRKSSRASMSSPCTASLTSQPCLTKLCPWKIIGSASTDLMRTATATQFTGRRLVGTRCAHTSWCSLVPIRGARRG